MFFLGYLIHSQGFICHLFQEGADFDLQAKYIPALDFANKVLLEHCDTHSLLLFVAAFVYNGRVK